MIFAIRIYITPFFKKVKSAKGAPMLTVELLHGIASLVKQR